MIDFAKIDELAARLPADAERLGSGWSVWPYDGSGYRVELVVGTERVEYTISRTRAAESEISSIDPVAEVKRVRDGAVRR